MKKASNHFAGARLLRSILLVAGATFLVASCRGDPERAAPGLTLAASPETVARASTSTLTWSSSGTDSCTASGAWTGKKNASGSAATAALTDAVNVFSLSCISRGGSARASAVVTIPGGRQSGLDFQGNSKAGTVRFRFTKPLDMYPATYIWRAYPRQQSGYYTTFFWATGGTQFRWDGGRGNSYYGPHPYPQNPPTGNTHYWEISTDFGLDVFGDPPVPVVYNRWYTQALVAWRTLTGKRTIFYYDLPDTSKFIDHTAPASFGNKNPPEPALTWGDAPWLHPEKPNTHGQGNEVYNGILRGIQVYSTRLSVANILSEASLPLSTTAGADNIWYLNLDPTPADISDKSGAGRHPEWVGSKRPLLWTGP